MPVRVDVAHQPRPAGHRSFGKQTFIEGEDVGSIGIRGPGIRGPAAVGIPDDARQAGQAVGGGAVFHLAPCHGSVCFVPRISIRRGVLAHPVATVEAVGPVGGIGAAVEFSCQRVGVSRCRTHAGPRALHGGLQQSVGTPRVIRVGLDAVVVDGHGGRQFAITGCRVVVIPGCCRAGDGFPGGGDFPILGKVVGERIERNGPQG